MMKQEDRNFPLFENKMRAAGVAEAAIQVFRENYEALRQQKTGTIPEEEILPLEKLATVSAPLAEIDGLMSQVVVIKLNGGLGTSMGLQGPKSLLEVRPGVNFLDLMVRQVLELRKTSGTKVRLLLMNSFSTSKATLAHLEKYRAEGLADAKEVELMQNQIPKIDALTLRPVEWPANRELEWCPPGHGDLYSALVGSGWLDRLLAEGVKYAFVSNSDNLGAILDPALLSHFVRSGAPFLMEATRRTDADRKGGHLAVRKSDGRLLLRELAQCLPKDSAAFQDIEKHRYFNTNNLWLRLDKLKELLLEGEGVLSLPMIRNEKTVDPRDKQSPAVVQLEIAMGAAIECFSGSVALNMPRSRFAPVKTNADLLALRSDAYEILVNGQVLLAKKRNGQPPNIKLSDDYKMLGQLASLGVPSLIDCQSLEISGPINFVEGVILQGTISILNGTGISQTIPAGIYKDQTLKF